MAKGKSLLKVRSKKKIRVDKIAAKLAAKKFYGDKAPNPLTDRAGFLNYCNAMIEMGEARDWMEEYLSLSGRTLKGVPDSSVNRSACHRARMKYLKVPFTEEQDVLLEKHIKEMLRHRAEDTEEAPEKPKLSIQDHIREKFSDIMGELEGMFDDGIPADFDIGVWCREKEASPRIMGMILAKLRPVASELKQASSAVLLSNEEIEELGDAELIDDVKQIREAYRTMSRKMILAIFGDYQRVIEPMERLLENEKRARAPRKVKPPSVEKQMKHFVHQPFSKDYNIQSVDPSKILGAQEVWTLNTKYKLVTVYRAESHGGKLGIERSRVSGVDRNNSFTYRLGRGQKSLSVIEDVAKSTRANAKKVCSGLKAAPLAERCNENTIILRVF